MSAEGLRASALWTRGLPELTVTGSLKEKHDEGATRFSFTVPLVVFHQTIYGSPRFALIDPDGWRIECGLVDVGQTEQMDFEEVRIVARPASFRCPSCQGNGYVWLESKADAPVVTCQRCEGEGWLPPMAIKGEWYVDNLGVVDGPGTYKGLPSEGERPLPPRIVPAIWRPQE